MMCCGSHNGQFGSYNTHRLLSVRSHAAQTMESDEPASGHLISQAQLM